MADDPKKALLMVLGKPSKGGGDMGDDKEGADYTNELKVALGELAESLGVEVKDEQKGIEALRTICDLCEREDEEEDQEKGM